MAPARRGNFNTLFFIGFFWRGAATPAGLRQFLPGQAPIRPAISAQAALYAG
jgi:hypothetical protein